MLVIRRLFATAARRPDDRGAVLVAVVGVMLVGFIVVSLIAAAVLFTIRSNSGNSSRTQAFIAAESGRDAAVAHIVQGCSTPTMPAGSDPVYSTQIFVKTGAQPTSSAEAGVALGCPTLTTDYIVIKSIGTGTDGSTATIDSVYPWTKTYSNVPGGVVTYFSGSVSQSVSVYTGDLVLRDGNYSCPQNGTLNGDLYVLDGNVSLSNGCKIYGDIYAKGNVTTNSSGWQILPRASSSSLGNVTSDSFVDLTSNGNPIVSGFISARGTVKLKAAGGGSGTVGGTVTSMTTTDIDPAPGWTTGAVTQNSTTPPVFDPTIEWLKAATKWIDLNGSSGWGTTSPINCADLQNANTATAAVKPQLSAGSTPLVLNYAACTKDVSLDLTGAITLSRDVVIIVGRDRGMSVDLGGLTAAGARSIFFVHEDGNIDDRDANNAPKPTCGSTGTRNQQDAFGTSGTIDSNIRVMVYSPCGLNGTVTASFSGQLYTDDTTNFHSGSAYTCQAMSWPGALPNLGCTIKGSGGVVESSTQVQRIGALVYQTER